MATLLAATTGLAARRQTNRARRMACSFWDGDIAGATPSFARLMPNQALH
jgi:hypothetical protein